MSDKHWWNSSEGLLRKVPELSNQKGWRLFAARYDDPAAKANRMEAFRESQRSRDPEASGVIDKVAELLRQIPRESPVQLFSADPESVREQATDGLAALVGSLFDPKNTTLFRGVLKEIECRESPPRIKKRILAEALEAFRSFILRDRRLPTREELNLEASCRKESVWRQMPYATGFRFGQKVKGGYIYETRSASRRVGSQAKICPLNFWNENRWLIAEVTRSIITPGGLKSIPRKERTVTEHWGDIALSAIL